jgi:glycosyltransferase involved in cell wall biosynthesis
MKRVLAGFIMDGKAGGIDKYLMNFLEAVKEDVQVDFLTGKIDEELRERLAVYHSELYSVEGLKHPVIQFRQICSILQNKHYDMIYLNVSTAIDFVAAFAGKKMGIRERVIHSHSSGNDCESTIQRLVYNVVHHICKTFFYRAGTRFYGCSVKAGEWIFPKRIVKSKRFEIIYNAVDGKLFQYNPKVRKDVRQELGIEDESIFAVGHLGNFCYAKNYPFLIDVFEQVYKKRKQSVLLLAGTGIELDEIKNLVRKKGLEGAVRFLGWRSDTNRLYQAMDMFLLPSRFEGLPIVGVEAQYTKLPCVFSDAITREANIQDHCYFFSLSETPEKWADFILEHKNCSRDDVKLTNKAGFYDLDNQKKQLRRIVCH